MQHCESAPKAAPCRSAHLFNTDVRDTFNIGDVITRSRPAAEEDDIEAELNALKAEFKKPPAGIAKAKVRFASTGTGCRGIRFIRNNELHHVATVQKIMENILATGEIRSRIVQRLVPVTHSCKAHMKDVGVCTQQATESTLGVSS